MANNRIRRFVAGGNNGHLSPERDLGRRWWTIHAGATGQSMSVAVDSSGNLYIADASANRVRKVTPSGTITP